MKNMFGEEVNPAELVISFNWINWRSGTLTIHRRGQIIGMVFVNGWNGVRNLREKLGAPILVVYEDNFSFNELQSIMEEYSKKISPKIALDIVLKQLAYDKNFSLDEAIAYLAENKIPCISV